MGRSSFEILFFTRKDTDKKTGKNLIHPKYSKTFFSAKMQPRLYWNILKSD